MVEALAYGAIAASSLVIGAALGLAWRWPHRQIGIVLAFGAGALISAVSFELAEEGIRVGGAEWLGLGLAIGASTYYLASRRLSGGARTKGRGHRPPSRVESDSSGKALALGATLDGIPEQLVLGIGLAAGGGVSASLLLAIFISNLPEAIGSASQMRESGHSGRSIIRLWVVVAAVVTLATVVGFGLADITGGRFAATINGFAAGALLVMLVDSMIPEARKSAGDVAGLIAVLGYAVAAVLSSLS